MIYLMREQVEEADRMRIISGPFGPARKAESCDFDD